ncbi:response regulator [Paenibacillus silvisoli]|uniref:response regulator n=1 Tax=Paenibacillus silvisoli TaxID=3110539 RepID=UPI0028041EFA|nr:response regulator [Paenibacillus silvisoli]
MLIVDDEPLLREGLIRKIAWEPLGLQLAGEAGDGFEAMFQLANCQPDIVLTDVRMPGMDGLQFINSARTNFPRTKFVIISGFDEFEYVREALLYNVRDYLLKPIDKEKLNTLLEGICEELRKEQLEAADRSRLTELDDMIRQSNLQPLDFQLTHLISEQEARWDGIPAGLMQCAAFAGASVKIVYRNESSRFQENEEPLARFAIQNIIENTLATEAGLQFLPFKHAYHTEEIIVFLGSERELALPRLVEMFRQTAEWIKQHLGLVISVGIGGVKSGMTQLRLSCMEARKALQNRLLFGNGNVYIDSETESATASSYPRVFVQAERALSAMLEEGRHQEFLDYAGQLFHKLSETSGARYEQVEYLYTDIIHMLRKHAAKTATDLPNWNLGTPIANLDSLTSWKDIISIIEQQLERLSGLLNRSADQSCDEIIESVKQYIEVHYAEELSLQWVGETYFIHPNYFSKRFKTVVGSSFNDYLTKVRIDRSKELLRTTTLKIARISQLVGYDDQNYFCNVFKKVTGISPSAYRS